MTKGKDGKATPPPEIGKVNTIDREKEIVRNSNLGDTGKVSVEEMLQKMTPEEQGELRQELDILLNGSENMLVNFKWLPEEVIADGKEIYCKKYSRHTKGVYDVIMAGFKEELSRLTEEAFFKWLEHVDDNRGFTYIDASGNRVPIIDVDEEMAQFFLYGRLDIYLYALEEWKLDKTPAENLIKEKINTWFEKPLNQNKEAPKSYRTRKRLEEKQKAEEEQRKQEQEEKQLNAEAEQEEAAAICLADKPKDRLAMITHEDYSGAFGFAERGKAHLQKIEDKENPDISFTFKKDENGNGYLLATTEGGQKTVPAKLIKDLKSKTPVTDIDTGLLQALYDFWLPAKQANSNIRRIKIRASELYEHITGKGCSNMYATTYKKDENGKVVINEKTGQPEINCLGFRESITNKVTKGFHNVVGIIDTGRREPSIYPPLLFSGYDSDTDVFSFDFPYFDYVWDMYKRNPATRIVTSKSGKTIKEIPKPTHSYLIHSDIYKERSKIAVENVRLIVDVIERAGGGEKNVHVSIETLIARNVLLKDRLENSNDIGKDLNRIFLKTYELLRYKTDLNKKYIDIKLPILKKSKAKDKKNYERYIPTPKNYKTFVINISHKGINKEYEADNK